ncbi:hypothetical protein PoB_004777000 [Plakobranchus ocellatus]|uniref:Uncharacterized protein n=1 Tax=Plakobranchus ocellatus TaxID=259542 RepID=A0AAV4BL65_9GAST|nr:hypothetical protein PoB_004777000 [Plakobranchus ocellatus]
MRWIESDKRDLVRNRKEGSSKREEKGLRIDVIKSEDHIAVRSASAKSSKTPTNAASASTTESASGTNSFDSGVTTTTTSCDASHDVQPARNEDDLSTVVKDLANLSMTVRPSTAPLSRPPVLSSERTAGAEAISSLSATSRNNLNDSLGGKTTETAGARHISTSGPSGPPADRSTSLHAETTFSGGDHSGARPKVKVPAFRTPVTASFRSSLGTQEPDPEPLSMYAASGKRLSQQNPNSGKPVEGVSEQQTGACVDMESGGGSGGSGGGPAGGSGRAESSGDGSDSGTGGCSSSGNSGTGGGACGGGGGGRRPNTVEEFLQMPVG